MATSHPEYNNETTATEVANAFEGNIHGKNGEYQMIELRQQC